MINLPTCYTCQKEIIFDKNIRSKTGKPIPLWPDRKNTHGHDDQGNAIRQPLPSNIAIPSQPQTFTNKTLSSPTPTDIPRTSQGGLPLDTKRIFQILKEMDTRLYNIEQKIEQNTNVDTQHLMGKLQTIYEVIEPLLSTQVKTGKELYEESDNPAFINHANRAEKYQEMMQNRRTPPTTEQQQQQTKFVDESKQKFTDADIPDSSEEFAVAQALKDEEEEGVIDEE